MQNIKKFVMLYLLPLKNKLAFKIGITNHHDLRRISLLARKYDINLDESYVISSKTNRTCIILEKQLLSDYSNFKYFDSIHGSIEFIEYRKLNDVINDIRFKARHTHLDIKIHKYWDFIAGATLSEKIKLGLENARKNGRIGGRPRIDTDKITEIFTLKDNGFNITQISKKLNLSRGTIYKYL